MSQFKTSNGTNGVQVSNWADPELQQLYTGVLACLIKYGKLSEERSRQYIEESKYLEVQSEMDKSLVLHELDYYWAMAILYDKVKPNWHLDPALWPPPEEYYDWLRTRQ